MFLDLDSLEYDMAQYLEHAPGHSGHPGHSPHPGHQTPHHHCHKVYQMVLKRELYLG